MTSSSSVSGGYEYEFVDAIAPKYYCSICKCVLRNARITVCCGHHYCDTCLTQWVKTQGLFKMCPHCRSANFQSVLNLEKIREINEFHVCCIFRDKGCGWVGELRALEGHLNPTTIEACRFVEVTCTNYGYEHIGIIRKMKTSHKFFCEVNLDVKTCEKVMQLQYFTAHQQNECKYRQFKCKYCGCVDTYDAIAGTGQVRNQQSVVIGTFTNHYNECGQYPLECPNLCGWKDIKRKDMKTHQETCPLKLLDCSLCGKRMRYRDMDNHKKLVCKFRPCTCKYCGVVETHESISGGELGSGPCHYDVCTHYPMTCRNRCGEKDIIRKNMKKHLQACPLEAIRCPFKSVGCSDKIQRKDMDHHMQTSVQTHLLLVLESHKHLEKSNRELRARIASLEGQR